MRHASGVERDEELLSGPVAAARDRVQNPRELRDRVAMGRALWRELVIGFAAQLGELRLGFTQLAALYVLVDTGTTTIADLADALGRSQSATSRLVDGLVKRGFVERRAETDDRRQRTVWLTASGPDAAGAGRPRAGRPVPGRGAAPADGGAHTDRDGRRSAGVACHHPAWAADQGPLRVSGAIWAVWVALSARAALAYCRRCERGRRKRRDLRKLRGGEPAGPEVLPALRNGACREMPQLRRHERARGRLLRRMRDEPPRASRSASPRRRGLRPRPSRSQRAPARDGAVRRPRRASRPSPRTATRRTSRDLLGRYFDAGARDHRALRRDRREVHRRRGDGRLGRADRARGRRRARGSRGPRPGRLPSASSLGRRASRRAPAC